jgi:hypothetical protein
MYNDIIDLEHSRQLGEARDLNESLKKVSILDLDLETPSTVLNRGEDILYTIRDVCRRRTTP